MSGLAWAVVSARISRWGNAVRNGDIWPKWFREPRRHWSWRSDRGPVREWCMSFCRASSFLWGRDHERDCESKQMPRTVPMVASSNALSLSGQAGASQAPTELQTSR